MKIVQAFLENEKRILNLLLILFFVLLLLPIFTTKRLKLGSEYETKEDVALYIKTFHELPSNYITKYAIETAPTYGGDLTDKIVGGDTHWNTNQFAEFGVSASTNLKECDIKGLNYNVLMNSRGRLRLVYTANTKHVRVFYSSEHYDIGSFEEMTTFELQLTRNIFWIIFSVYFISIAAFLFIAYKQKNKTINQENQLIE